MSSFLDVREIQGKFKMQDVTLPNGDRGETNGSTHISYAILALAGVALAACGEGPPDRPIAYRGEYHYDTEKAYLVQIGVDAKICIQGADMTPAVQPEFSASGGISDVAVRGILSKPGRYGHLEACTYVLSDAELLGVGERRARE